MYLDNNFGGPTWQERGTRKAARRELVDIIERAMAALDAIDGDPDLEPDDDEEDGGDLEPSLGSSEPYKHFLSQIVWCGGGSDDLESGVS